MWFDTSKGDPKVLAYGVVYKVLGTYLAKEIQREYFGDSFAKPTTLYNTAI
jgi:hypothetical protein